MFDPRFEPVFGYSGNIPGSFTPKIIGRVARNAVMVVAPEFDTNPNLRIQESRSNKRVRISIDQISAYNKSDIGLGALLSSVNEDVLLEIFLRLPNCRSAIQLSSVCRVWHALISQSQFIPSFIRFHPSRDQSYTILLRMSPYMPLMDKPEYYQLICTIFSEESLLIHGKKHSLLSSNYLDFMPSLMTVRASCNDLLLVSPDSRYRNPSFPRPERLYICNPVINKWFLIPKEAPRATRMGFALLCMPDYNDVSNTTRYSYKVVLIDQGTTGFAPIADADYYEQTVWVFCFKSGQWTNNIFSVPWCHPHNIKIDYGTSPNVVPCNWILYWIDSLFDCDRIVALDIACNRCDVIYFPDIVQNRSRWIPDIRTHLGVVKDELRLLRVLKTEPTPKCFVARVWELDHRGGSWGLIGQRELSFPDAVSTDDGRDTLVAAIFHPQDCDLIFVVCGKSVYECGVSNDKCRKLGEIHESVGHEGLASFVLMHPPWPTPVPCV